MSEFKLGLAHINVGQTRISNPYFKEQHYTRGTRVFCVMAEVGEITVLNFKMFGKNPGDTADYSKLPV